MPKIERPKHYDLITTAQAADLLDKHIRTIHRLVADGMLTPAAKVPGKTGAYLFDRREVEQLAARGAA